MTWAHLQRRRGQDGDNDIRGAAAEAIIAALPDLVASYPYTDRYNVWPSPNSNTPWGWLSICLALAALAEPGLLECSIKRP